MLFWLIACQFQPNPSQSVWHHPRALINITKSYKQAPAQTYNDINNEAKDIAHPLELSDRMNCLAKKEAFITLKDLELYERAALSTYQPSEQWDGKSVKGSAWLYPWSHQPEVTSQYVEEHCFCDWMVYKDRQERERATFFCFDVVDFYPSFTEDLLKRALKFAEQYTTISDQEKDIILHSRKSMLFMITQDKEWIKKGTGLFDVTMGCYDGAEICQLVGTFALATITKAIPTASIGLYRDDGLGVLLDMPGS